MFAGTTMPMRSSAITHHKLAKVFGLELGCRNHLHFHDLDGTRPGSVASSHVTIYHNINAFAFQMSTTKATAYLYIILLL